MLRRVTSLLALALIVAGSTPSVRAQELIAVRLGSVNSITDAPLYIADKKGWFRAEGLDVQTTIFDSAASMMAPLGAGQLDVAAGGTSAGLFNAVARGIDMRVVADKAIDPPGYGFAPLLVRTDLVKSGKYKALKDLKGTTVALSAPGSSSWPELAGVLDKAGLKWDDVKRQPLDYAQHVVAFKNESIEASITIEPFATLIVQTGLAQRIMGNDEYYVNQEVAVLIYGSAFLKTRRDVGLRFMRAYLKGVRYYNDALRNGKMSGRNADDVIKILTESSPVKDPAIFRQLTPNGVDPNGKVNVASMQKDLDFYRTLGMIQGQIEAKDTIDESFASEIVKQLGPYRKLR